MVTMIMGDSRPVKIWATDADQKTIEQIKNAADLPFIFKHVALMPDAHFGYGVPIGTVFATSGEIVPNAVGVDIGCGVCAVQTSLLASDLTAQNISDIVDAIKDIVPLGHDWQVKPQSKDLLPVRRESDGDMPVVDAQIERATYQLGTLGGGNHFIELQYDVNGHVWIMIHSGSRNLGLKVATHYAAAAKHENDRWYSDIPDNSNLHFLPINSYHGKCYIREVRYCVEFAKANRRLMRCRIMDVLGEMFPLKVGAEWNIDISHNYVRWEHHFNKNVLVHRKGATSARSGEYGLIPGSMGTSSFVVTGLGNKESFMSCSHGAGRRLGRAAAKDSLSLSQQQKLLNDKGVFHDLSGIDKLDEAPDAYKNIYSVMDAQKDLVKITEKLSPIASIKG